MSSNDNYQYQSNSPGDNGTLYNTPLQLGFNEVDNGSNFILRRKPAPRATGFTAEPSIQAASGTDFDGAVNYDNSPYYFQSGQPASGGAKPSTAGYHLNRPPDALPYGYAGINNGSDGALGMGFQPHVGRDRTQSDAGSSSTRSHPRFEYPENRPASNHYTDSPYARFSTRDPMEITNLANIEAAAVDSDEEDVDPSKRKSGFGGIAKVFNGGYQAAPVGQQVAGGESRSGLLSGPASAGGLGGPEPKRNAVEDSEWLRSQKKSSTKYKKIRYILIALVVLIIVAGAVIGAIFGRRKAASPSDAADQANAPHLNSNSDAIKSLMNNPNLHRSFYGMDYTPLGAAEYPHCTATFNNVTKDIAVMSQLTKRVRLYGNDCQQTELVVDAINSLKVDMKVWMGVYLDNNPTTNERQLADMYRLFKKYGTSPFEGVIIGNEVLFRQDLTRAQLIDTLEGVRKNLSSLDIKLPVATADLGSNWDSTLASSVDTLMANVHPFFAGVTVEDAATWTNTFFQQNDVFYANQVSNKPMSIISEVGWPSAGGKINGSIAGIKEMNTFMETFVCQANEKGLKYFWFEALDEPWKIRFDTPGREFEDKWGLFDVNRNLKDGLVIPNCKTKP